MNKRTLLLSAAAAAACTLAGAPACGQSAAARPPLKIIVATPAGGASDTAARVVADFLARARGQAVVVENKPGGNGVPAMLAVLSAPSDGQTLLWAMSSMAGTPLLVKSAPVKSFGEFAAVAPVVDLLYGLVVNPAVPATTVSELTAWLKANPGRASYGTGVLSEYMVTAHCRLLGWSQLYSDGFSHRLGVHDLDQKTAAK